MLEFKRADRVRALLQRELSEVIHRSVRDPRVRFCTVAAVELSPDLKYADIRISVVGNNKEKQGSLAGLKSASGFLRREVGRRIGLRYTPELRFELDESVDHLMRIDRLLKQVDDDAEKNDSAKTAGKDG